MPGLLGLALVLGGMAVLVFFHGEERIAGLEPGQFAGAISLAAMGLLVASSAFGAYRGRVVEGLTTLLFWLLMLVGLVGLYSYRYEAQEVASRILGEIVPGQTVTARGGEVAVARRGDGSFVVTGRVEERDLRFIFDTGASVVVLTHESARSIGITPTEIDFSVPVSTANGRTMAAPVTLQSLSIGGITARRVRALVARPGALHENLLGMTFLERLESYEVRRNRLILRGHEPAG